MLKFFQYQGRFPSAIKDLPIDVVRFLSQQIGASQSDLDTYDWDGRTATRQRAEILSFLGIRRMTSERMQPLTTTCFLRIILQISYLDDGLEVLPEVAGADSGRIMAYYRANNQIVSLQEYSGLYENPPRQEQQFYIYDGLGRVSALATDNGGITDRYQYDAFGEFTKTLNSEEDPGTGVWTTPDPIGILGGINLYSYVSNNPVNWGNLNIHTKSTKLGLINPSHCF